MGCPQIWGSVLREPDKLHGVGRPSRRGRRTVAPAGRTPPDPGRGNHRLEGPRPGGGGPGGRGQPRADSSPGSTHSPSVELDNNHCQRNRVMRLRSMPQRFPGVLASRRLSGCSRVRYPRPRPDTRSRLLLSAIARNLTNRRLVLLSVAVCQPGIMASQRSLWELLAERGICVADRFGAAAADRLSHLCTPGRGALFVPYGYAGPTGPLDLCSSPQVQIRVDEHAGIGAHPCNPSQLPVVAIARQGSGPATDAYVEMVSVAHLAHRDCRPCAQVWLDRAAEYEVALRAVEEHAPGTTESWSLFTLMPTVDDESLRVLIHPGDLPPHT